MEAFIPRSALPCCLQHRHMYVLLLKPIRIHTSIDTLMPGHAEPSENLQRAWPAVLPAEVQGAGAATS